MRSHITKSLQTRCKAIQQAITAYNAAAANLDPPRPSLNWAEVGGYSFLEQFALLQDTRQDVRDRRWTESTVRAVMKKRNRIRRAHEEIERLNVEVRRLHTAVRDEELLFRSVCTRLQAANDPLLGALQEFVQRRRRINAELLARVHQIYKLDGFNGTPNPGTRLGSLPLDPEIAKELDILVATDDQAADADVDVLEGDEEQAALAHLVEFLGSLSLSS